jgi:hypothetical protein
MAYYYTLKMEAKYSYETLVGFQQNIRRYRNFDTHRCENMKKQEEKQVSEINLPFNYHNFGHYPS